MEKFLNKPQEEKTFYHGEVDCTFIPISGKSKGKKCDKKAYFIQNGRPLCGFHSDKLKRKNLPKNPDAKIIIENHLRELEKKVEETAKQNRQKGQKGKVVLTPLTFFKEEVEIPGFKKVFPNYKHQDIKRGFGCSSLSPKSMGPVKHEMLGLPPAKNLENYWQFSKVFSCEVDEDVDPTEEFRKRRIDGFNDPDPHRHKFDKKKMNEIAKEQDNKNVPLYSVFSDKNGIEKRYTYIEGRWFYCSVYEQFATKDKNFLKLKEWLDQGYNLQIVGYDANDVGDRDLDEVYLDGSKPFGHERVLYSMLTINDPKDYPWNKYHEKWRGIYF